MGGPASFLNFPKSPEYQNPGATGFRSEFINGSIYWSPSTGAHPVTLLYMAKWAANNWETGYMGYPTTDEFLNADGIGSHQEFQHGATYWHPFSGTYNLGGAIRDKWDTIGSETHEGLLGYPVSDEETLPDGQGRMNRFQRGVIYWHPTTGAHPIGGLSLAFWSLSGYENSSYGYPTGSEYTTTGGEVSQSFQNGELNLTQMILSAGTVPLAGKDVYKPLADQLEAYAAANGFNLEDVLLEGSAGPSLMASGNFGGVTIPAGYVYNPSLGSLNDYCTKSPDQFPSPGKNANFSGACARHDMCYASSTNNSQMATCNRKFQQDLVKVCENVYTGTLDARRPACRTTARTYYEAVVLAHPSHWNAHLFN